MSRVRHVAVLGAGIMGVCTALFLTRRGVRVTLIDVAHEPMSGASRWNEGKIHLGFLYSADASLATAQSVLTGGLLFRPLIESLVGLSIAPALTPVDDIYLCHPESVVPSDAMHSYFNQVADMVRRHPDAGRYCTDVSRCDVHALTRPQLEQFASARAAVTGFTVPERSVDTVWLADRLVDAVRAAPAIEFWSDAQVTAVRPVEKATPSGAWQVALRRAGDARTDWHGPFDAVVNALWQGRLAVDATVPMPLPSTWSHRLRYSLFVRTATTVDWPSVVLATGPFGDVKNYNGRDLYLSWYPAGLVAETSTLAPERFTPPDATQRAHIVQQTLTQLAALLPPLAALRERAEHIEVGGGWVYAAGKGALSDPAATIHRRDRLGVTRHGRYLSVDTGKYSTAPWLAGQVSDWLVSTG